MKFNNQFFVTVNYFIKSVLYRHNFGYKQSWFKTKLAIVLTWFGLKYVDEREKIDTEEIDIAEYEDPWTNDLFVHLVELSDGQKLPILCASVTEAWDRIESWLFEKGDFETSIIQVTKDEYSQ